MRKLKEVELFKIESTSVLDDLPPGTVSSFNAPFEATGVFANAEVEPATPEEVQVRRMFRIKDKNGRWVKKGCPTQEQIEAAFAKEGLRGVMK